MEGKKPQQLAPKKPEKELEAPETHPLLTVGSPKLGKPDLMPKTESFPTKAGWRQSFISRKALVVAVLVFLALLIVFSGVGMAAAYTNYKFFTPPTFIKDSIDAFILATPLPKTPRLVLAKTVKAMDKLKTAFVETQIEFSIKDGTFPIKSAKVTSRGPVDFKTINQTRSQSDLTVEIAAEGLEISISGTMLSIDNKIYFKISEFPQGTLLPSQGLKDQWFVINTKDIQQLKIDYQKDEIKDKKLKEIFEKFLARSYSWSSFTKTQERDVFELLVKPPKEEISGLISEIIESLGLKNQTSLGTSLEKKNLENLIKNLENIETTVKIGKKDYLISEANLLISANIRPPAGLLKSSKITLTPATSSSVKVTAGVKLSNFNQPIIVEEPNGAQDFSGYIAGFKNLLPATATPSASLAPQEPKSGFGQLLEKPSPILPP